MRTRIAIGLIILGSIALLLSGFSAGVAGELKGTNETVQISPAVENASGEQTILVSLESNTETIAAQSDELTRAETVNLLQTEASQSQSPLIEFAERTPAVTVETTFWIENTVLLTIDHDRIDVKEIAEIDAVTRITPNNEITPLTTTATKEPVLSRNSILGGFEGKMAPPSDETSTTTSVWGISRINAPEVWEEFDTRGENVSVAVLDSGVDTEHPDIPELSEEQWAEWDANGNEIDTDPHDPDGHGTHVSGTAVGGNASGSHIGVAPDADLYHGKVFECDTSCLGSEAQLLAGIEWAVESEVDVVSMSLGSEGYDKDLIEPIQNAKQAGTVIVAAAGNTPGLSSSPGNVYETISVGASTPRDTIADFSSGEVVNKTRAWWPDPPAEWPEEYVVPTVSAPGVETLSAVPTDQGGGYRESRGTSMATPHVAGVVALMLSVNDDLSPEGVRDVLEKSAEDIDEPEWKQGSGRVDALAAVESATEITAAFIHTPGGPVVGETVEFEDASSTGPDTSILTRKWDLTGDNTTDETGATVTHTYDEPGEYEVTLTVTDEDGDSDTVTETITIREAGKDAIKIKDWYDLDAIRENVSSDYVLVSDLDENTDGYEWVVNRKKEEFSEFVSGEPVEAGDQFELPHDDIEEIQAGLDSGSGEEIDPENIELVDPETGLIEVLVDTEGALIVEYVTQDPRFVGFDPIGTGNRPFAGTFDGQGHEIRDLQINRPFETQLALFGYTGEIGTEQEGVIKNLTVAESVVSGGFAKGLIAAGHGGLIINSTAKGTVEGGHRAGLIAGATEGKIVRSDAEGVVDVEDTAGGLTGVVDEDGIIEKSVADVEVTGESRSGGLVGRLSNGTVEESYAVGNVTGSQRLGAFAGQIDEDGEITESFATGAVDGDDRIGGVVGRNLGGSITESYWDVNSTGQSDGIGTGDGGDVTGLTTDEMQGEAAVENMDALDFDETWQAVTDPDDYPMLQWQTLPAANTPPTADTGDGQTVSEEAQVELDATGSSDPDGDSLSYSWVQTAGPSVSIEDADTATPTVTTPAVDTETDLVFEVTVDDGSATDTTSVTVTVTPNSGPTVADYANEDGIVGTGGLRDAIDDWRANKIDTALLRDVIEAWRSGEPVN